MTPARFVLGLVLGLVACSPAEQATTTTTTTTTIAAPDLAKLKQFVGPSRADQLLSAEVVGGTLEISTSLFRDAESGPVGLGICIAAQEAGAEGHVRVLGSDGGTIASTREDLSGNNAGKLCGIRVDQ